MAVPTAITTAHSPNATGKTEYTKPTNLINPWLKQQKEHTGSPAYMAGINHVTVGGETGREARVCNYDWVLDIRNQCLKAGKTFWFKNTGSLFEHDGKVQKINPFKQSAVAYGYFPYICKNKKNNGNNYF